MEIRKVAQLKKKMFVKAPPSDLEQTEITNLENEL